MNLRVNSKGLLHGAGRDLCDRSGNTADVLAYLRYPFCRVGRGQDRHFFTIGDRIGAEGLLGKGRADNGDDFVPINQILKRIDGAGLIPACILENKPYGRPVDPSLGVEEFFRQSGADGLFLAKEGDIACPRHADPDGNGRSDLIRISDGCAKNQTQCP